MMKKIALFLALCTYFMPLKAQEEGRFTELNEQTYQAFLNQDWQQVIVLGEQALSEDIDYYYLRTRLGVAYFNTQQYAQAEKNFRQALEFSHRDVFSVEYLYFSLWQQQKYEEASTWIQYVSPDLQQKMKARPTKPINAIAITGGQKISSQPENTASVGNIPYFQIAMHHAFSPKVWATQAFSFVSQQMHWGEVQQLQYHAQVDWQIANNLYIYPAITGVFNNGNFLDTVLIAPRPPFPPNSSPREVIISEDFSNQAFVLGLQIEKRWQHFRIAPFLSFANLNETTQLEYGLGGSVVFGRAKKVSLGATAFQILQDGETTEGFRGSFGVGITNFWGIQLSGYQGNSLNFQENNGMVVQNSLDLTLNQWSVMNSFVLSNEASIFLLYQAETRQENTADTDFTYILNTFIIGLTLKL